MNVIPKIIHYCWFGGGKEDGLVEACKNSWAEHLNDYQIVRWDESNVDLELPFLKKWHKAKQWAFVADYVRLKALYEYGGVYLDTDIEVIKPFDGLLENEVFIGEESEGRYCNAVIGAAPQSEFILACMKIMEDRWYSNKSFYIGPEVIAAALSIREFKVERLSPEVFYPYNPYDHSRSVAVLMYRDIKPSTYAIHHWNKSWNFSFFQRVLRKLGW